MLSCVQYKLESNYQATRCMCAMYVCALLCTLHIVFRGAAKHRDKLHTNILLDAPPPPHPSTHGRPGMLRCLASLAYSGQ